MTPHAWHQPGQSCGTETQNKSEQKCIPPEESTGISPDAEFQQWLAQLDEEARQRLNHLIQREFAYRKLPVPANALTLVGQSYRMMIKLAIRAIPDADQSTMQHASRFEAIFGAAPLEITDPVKRKHLLQESQKLIGHLVSFAVRTYMHNPYNPRLPEHYLRLIGGSLEYLYKAKDPTERTLLKITGAGLIQRLIDKSPVLTVMFKELVELEYKLSGVSLIRHRLSDDEREREARMAGQSVSEKIMERLTGLVAETAQDLLQNKPVYQMNTRQQAVHSGLVELATPIPQSVYNIDRAKQKIEQGKQRLLAIVMELLFEEAQVQV